MRYLKAMFLIGSLLTCVILAGCRPAATPPPRSSTPLPSAIPQQVVPDATLDLSVTATPTLPAQSAATSGVRIIAQLGPSCPGPERPGQVCTAPYVGEFSITSSTDAAAIRVVSTDKEGQVTVELPPGRYTVTPKIEGRFPSGAPVDVTVPPGQVVDVNMELDSGMR